MYWISSIRDTQYWVPNVRGHQTEFSLVTNQSENGIYNLILFDLTRNRKNLSVCTYI